MTPTPPQHATFGDYMARMVDYMDTMEAITYGVAGLQRLYVEDHIDLERLEHLLPIALEEGEGPQS